MRAFRCQVRLALNDIDREVYAERVISLAQEPDEPDEHILLRFLAFVFFYDERLADAGGWTHLAEPDLQADNLIGDTTLVIECGQPQRIKRLVRAVGRNKHARVIALFADEQELTDFQRDWQAARPRDPKRLEIYRVSSSLMRSLEEIGSRSMQWQATLNDGQLYLECDGQMLQGHLIDVASQ
ncbi:MAG TPA: hypothetical protein DCQ06_14130 [Myxococcales bacterium]|mgnify:CR=1 FL=1|nr:hypothetical protein [Myxococcales bacterium]